MYNFCTHRHGSERCVSWPDVIATKPRFNYLRQGGYVIVVICLSVSNFRKDFQMDLHEIFRECWEWASEQMIKF